MQMECKVQVCKNEIEKSYRVFCKSCSQVADKGKRYMFEQFNCTRQNEIRHEIQKQCYGRCPSDIDKDELYIKVTSRSFANPKEKRLNSNEKGQIHQMIKVLESIDKCVDWYVYRYAYNLIYKCMKTLWKERNRDREKQKNMADKQLPQEVESDVQERKEQAQQIMKYFLVEIEKSNNNGNTTRTIRIEEEVKVMNVLFEMGIVYEVFVDDTQWPLKKIAEWLNKKKEVKHETSETVGKVKKRILLKWKSFVSRLRFYNLLEKKYPNDFGNIIKIIKIATENDFVTAGEDEKLNWRPYAIAEFLNKEECTEEWGLKQVEKVINTLNESRRHFHKYIGSEKAKKVLEFLSQPIFFFG